jgi:hypothetical protein
MQTMNSGESRRKSKEHFLRMLQNQNKTDFVSKISVSETAELIRKEGVSSPSRGKDCLGSSCPYKGKVP